MIRRTILMTLLISCVIACIGAAFLQAQVSSERIVRSGQEPQNWLTYSGTLSGWRHSLLTQITPANVGGLTLTWIWQSGGAAQNFAPHAVWYPGPSVGR